jgi:hypothetical protein
MPNAKNAKYQNRRPPRGVIAFGIEYLAFGIDTDGGRCPPDLRQ